MTSKWFLWFPVVAIVIVALLVGGGYAIYRGGWESGYAAAEAAAEGGEAVAAWPHHGLWPRGHSLSIGTVLLGAFFFLLALGAVSHVLRLLAWRKLAAAGPEVAPGPWARRWCWGHGPVHPWHPSHWSCGYGPPGEDQDTQPQGPSPAEE